MWEIKNHTPFPCAGGFQRDHKGRTFWCAWIRSTFVIRHDRPVLFTPDQTPLAQSPVFEGGDPEKALIHDTDICLPKPRVDLLINAAVPSAKEPVPVSAQLGQWRKELTVHPAAKWHRWMGAVNIDPAPTDPVRLGWESTSGGPDNPLGIGTFEQKTDAVQQDCARVFYPDAHQTNPTKPVRPGAFAPVPRQWPAREQFSGTYDTNWERTRAPLLPADLDTRYWQAAPADQTLDRDQIAGHPLVLTNMGWPGADLLEINLPDLAFDISVMFKRRWQTVEAELQTISLDLPTAKMSLTHMIAFPINAAQNDVYVKQTYVALPKMSGFSVAAAHADLFANPALVQEPA